MRGLSDGKWKVAHKSLNRTEPCSFSDPVQLAKAFVNRQPEDVESGLEGKANTKDNATQSNRL